MPGARLGIVALGLVTVVGYAVDLRAVLGLEVDGMMWYVSVFALQFVLYLTASWLAHRYAARDRLVLIVIVGFAVLFRLVVVPTPLRLSSDPYRYLWDGRVQWAGVNPYRYAPAAPELAHLRDGAIHPNINRPTKRTVYPPGAEMLFALAAGVAPGSLLGWRLFLLACEVLTGLLLLRLLRRMGRPPAAVIWYAWAPLVVFEGVQAAHVDVAVLPLLLLALLWRQDGRMAAAGAALGAAVLIKLYPTVLLVAWWRRGEWRFPAACIVTVAVGYLPYTLPVGLGVLGFLPEYFSSGEDFNIGLRWFAIQGIGFSVDGVAREVARGVAMLLLSSVLAAVLLRIRRRLIESVDGIFAASLTAVGAYLLLVPTALHPWYALWIVPFLAVRPVPGWLWFSGAVALSYLAYAWKPLPFPLWARLLEFAPLWAWLVFDRWRAASPAPFTPPVVAPSRESP